MYYLIIPAFEPDEKLLHLLEEVSVRLDCHTVIIDDGSSKDKEGIFQKAHQYATVLTHAKNMGKGQALRTGFRYVQALRISTVVVTADADGQHSVTDIDRVARAAMHLPKHLILGSRQFTKDIPLRSLFGNKLTQLLFKFQTGVTVSDTQTGLRGFHNFLLPFMLGIEGNRYEYEMNMLTQVSREYQITEIPIQTIYIDDNASSHFRPIKDGLTIYKNLLKFSLASLDGFITDYLVYILALTLLATFPTGSRILWSNTIARLCSASLNYSLNKKMVFQHKGNGTQTGFGYLLLALTLFIADTFLIYLFHQTLGINVYAVKIFVGITLFFASWFVQKNIIFRERKQLRHEIF